LCLAKTTNIIASSNSTAPLPRKGSNSYSTSSTQQHDQATFLPLDVSTKPQLSLVSKHQYNPPNGLNMHQQSPQTLKGPEQTNGDLNVTSLAGVTKKKKILAQQLT